MVATTDLKSYKSASGGLGGGIDLAAQIITNSGNNFFTNSTGAEAAAGEDYYGCAWHKNTHASENMDEFRWWMDADSPQPDSTYKWGFDPLVYPQPCVFFDGVDDYIDCTNDSTLWSQGLNKFSYYIEVFPTATAGTNRDFVRHASGSSASRFRTELLVSSTDVRFMIRNAANTTDAVATASGLLILNQWNKILCTYDNSLVSANLKIYVNGTLGATTGDLTETVNSSVTLTLMGNSAQMGGYAREFMWWTTNALTQTDANNLNSGNYSAVISPHYWLKMNEGTGNPVDSVSGTKVGTLTGGALWQLNAQTITDKYTAPVGVIWQSADARPDDPTFPTVKFGTAFPTWIWKHINAGCKARTDDPDLFAFSFKIPIAGSGTPGGGGSGSGGNPPPTPTNYKVALAGDWGCGSVTNSVIALINSQAYDFVVGVGDNAYASASCWTSAFKPLKDAHKLNSAYGNHEYEESGGISPYETFFGHQKTYFTFQFQNIFFLVLDTNIDMDTGSAQYNFVVSELDRVKNDASVVWKIAVMHHPWFGASSQHSYDTANAVENFHTLFITNKVSFVVTGHNHNWQRTHSVGFNTANPTSPTIVSSTPPFSRSMNGLIHVISGTGGHDSGSGLYSLGSQPSFQAYQNRTHNGVWEIVASNNGNTLTCQFREVGGDVFDTFVINA